MLAKKFIEDKTIYSEPCLTSKKECFAKIANIRYLTGFWIRLCFGCDKTRKIEKVQKALMRSMSKLKFTADAFQVAIPHFLEIEIYSDPTGTYIK